MKRIFFAFLFCLYALSLFASIENFPNDLKSYFACSTAQITQINGNTLEISGGYDNGFIKGRKVKIYKKSVPIVHPVTKKIIANRKVKVAEGIITNAEKNFSIVTIEKSYSQVNPDDSSVECASPLNITITNGNSSKDGEALATLLKSKFNSERDIIISENGDFTAEVLVNGSEFNIDIKDRNHKLLKSFTYPKDGEIIIRKSVQTVEVAKSNIIEKNYHSLTVFKYAEDNFIATAYKHGIDIYQTKNGQFLKIENTVTSSDEIINIESYDVNGDGNDEIITSALSNTLTPKSKIFIFNGNSLSQAHTDLPYLFRTTYNNGNKLLLYQKVLHDKFESVIYKFSTINNLGNNNDVIADSNNFNIYNIGIGDMDNDGKDDVLYITKDNSLAIISNGKDLFKSVEKYGAGSYYFFLDNKAKEKSLNNDSDKSDALELLKYRIFVYPRMYVKEGQLFLYQNKPKFPFLPLTEAYSESYIHRISYNNLGLTKTWSSSIFEPKIIDMDFNLSQSSPVILILKNISKSFPLREYSQIISLTIN
jgi:hypothetical protein